MGRSLTAVPGRRSGFSLLEVMIYIVVMVIVGGPLTMVALSTSRASAEGDMLSKILERNRSSIQRITSEFRESLGGTVSIASGGKALQFTSCSGFDGTAPVAGPIVRYEIRPESGESINNADDDGDGLIDEGLLVRAEGAGTEVVLTNVVQTGMSSFALNGSGIAITLTTTGRARGATAPTDMQRSITVSPRN